MRFPAKIRAAGYRVRALAAVALPCWLLASGCVPRPDGITRLQYSLWGSVSQQTVEREIIAGFERENPDVRVEMLPIALNHYPEKIQAMMVGGIAPDVITVEMRTYSEWAARGVLADLTGETALIEAGDTLLPVPRQAFERNGRLYAFPINCHGPVAYCNLDALAAAGVPFPADGWSWAELAALGPRLSRRAGRPDAPTDYAMILPAPSTVLASFGVSLFDDLYHPRRVTVNGPEARAAIGFLRAMRVGKLAVPSDVLLDEGSYQLFRDGRVAVYFSGRWDAPNFAGRTRFRWDVAPIPAAAGGRRISVHGGTALAVWAGARHPEAARRFVRYYAGARGSEISMRAGRTVPVFQQIAFGPDFLGLRPPVSIRRFAETMEKGAATYPVYAPGAGEVTQIVQARMEQAMSEPDLPAAAVLAGLQDDLERWLARYQVKFGASAS